MGYDVKKNKMEDRDDNLELKFSAKPKKNVVSMRAAFE